MARGRRAGRQRPAVPMRRCVGCKKVKPAADLLRLVIRAGEVLPDPEKRMPGRGCSICRDPECARKAIKTRQIGRALRGGAPDPAIDRLLSWLAADRFA